MSNFPRKRSCGGFKIVCALILPLTLIAGQAQAGPPQYTVTVLGSLPGGNSGEACAINANGQAAGASNTSDNTTHDAVVWSGTNPADLGTLGGSLGCIALGINDPGIVVGYSYTPGNSSLAALEWTGTTPTILGSLGGAQSQASAINDAGVVVGSSETSGQVIDAVKWTGTTPTILGSIGGTFSKAFGINGLGEIAGFSETTGNQAQDAVEWTGTTPTTLGSLGGTSQAFAINDAGVAVGMSNSEAVVWTGTAPTAIPTLGGNFGEALAINSSGQAVGLSGTMGGSIAGFVYWGGLTYDITSLLSPGSGVTSFSAQGINDSGQIAGYGIISGKTYAMTLSPVAVPEPCSAALAALAGCAMATSRLRRIWKSMASEGRLSFYFRPLL